MAAKAREAEQRCAKERDALLSDVEDRRAALEGLRARLQGQAQARREVENAR